MRLKCRAKNSKALSSAEGASVAVVALCVMANGLNSSAISKLALVRLVTRKCARAARRGLCELAITVLLIEKLH
jgi:hypothetical protein